MKGAPWHPGDITRVFKMRAAGWTDEAIAEQMGRTVKAIYAIVHKNRAKMEKRMQRPRGRPVYGDDWAKPLRSWPEGIRFDDDARARRAEPKLAIGPHPNWVHDLGHASSVAVTASIARRR